MQEKELKDFINSILQKTTKLHQLAGDLQAKFSDERAGRPWFPQNTHFQFDFTGSGWIGFICNSHSYFFSDGLHCFARAVESLEASCKKMEHEYDKLIKLKTQGELQGFEKTLILIGFTMFYTTKVAIIAYIPQPVILNIVYNNDTWRPQDRPRAKGCYQQCNLRAPGLALSGPTVILKIAGGLRNALSYCKIYIHMALKWTVEVLWSIGHPSQSPAMS